jgi:energy-coupling factor transporter ATP-binding protein EcfA2
MDIKVDAIRSRSGSYKFRIDGIEFTEAKAKDFLIAKDMRASEADECLNAAKGATLNTSPNKRFDLTVPILTQDDLKILEPIRYTYTEKGEVQWLICKNTETNTYTPSPTIEQGLRSQSLNGTSMYEFIKSEFYTPILQDMCQEDMTRLTPIASDIQWAEDSQSIIAKNTLYFQHYLASARPFMEEETEKFLLKDVKSLSNDPKIPNYMFFDKETVMEGDCSAWLEFEEHFDKFEREYFRAWIWSIFEEQCTDTRVLYLYDNGGGGKSTMINALQGALGHAFGVIDSNHLGSTFLGAEIAGKRLIVEPDNKSPNICMTGIIHKIATGDSIRVEHKGRDSYTMKVYSRVLIAGNIRPIIDADKQSDARRLALIELKPYSDEIQKRIYRTDKEGNFILTETGHKIFIGNHNFAEKMKDQLTAYLFLCRKSYERHCPNHDSIALPKSMASSQSELTMSDDKRMTSILVDKYVKIAPKEFCTAESFSYFLRNLAGDKGTKTSYIRNDIEKIILGKAEKLGVRIEMGASRRIDFQGTKVSKRVNLGFSITLPDEYVKPHEVIRDSVTALNESTLANEE